MNKRRRFKAKANRYARLKLEHVLQRIRQAQTQKMSIATYVNLRNRIKEIPRSVERDFDLLYLAGRN